MTREEFKCPAKMPGKGRAGRPSVRSKSNLPDDGAVTAAVKKLLSEQTLAALATSGRDGAYVNLGACPGKTF